MRSISGSKLLAGKHDSKAFESYKSRNFWRAYARSVAGEYGRKLFKVNAMHEANGKYEPFVMPAIERQLEAVIARQIKGMNILYPPGNYSMLREKFRVSELDKARNPVWWGYARIPFGKFLERGYVPDYYRRKYEHCGKRMTYASYPFAPHQWLTKCHNIVLDQKDMDKAEKARKRWDRKPFYQQMPHEELTFLLAAIPAYIDENLQFLNEIRNGEHTYMEHNPIVTVDMVRNASER